MPKQTFLLHHFFSDSLICSIFDTICFNESPYLIERFIDEIWVHLQKTSNLKKLNAGVNVLATMIWLSQLKRAKKSIEYQFHGEVRGYLSDLIQKVNAALLNQGAAWGPMRRETGKDDHLSS